MPLGTSLYDWLLFLHIIGATVWLGGVIMISLLATLVLRSRDPELVKRFIRGIRIAGAALGLSMLAVLGLGIWMVVRSRAWDFGQGWVISALGLFAAVFAIGIPFQARAAIGAQRAAEGGDHNEASRQLSRWAWGMESIALILVVAVWDMVAKPGL